MVGENIRRVRTSLGISQEELAVKLGVPPKQIANLELGLSHANSDDLSRLATALNTTPDALLSTEPPSADAISNVTDSEVQTLEKIHTLDTRGLQNFIHMLSLAYSHGKSCNNGVQESSKPT